MYFDQLLGAACTKKLVETFFSAVFQHIIYFIAIVNVLHVKTIFVAENCESLMVKFKLFLQKIVRV